MFSATSYTAENAVQTPGSFKKPPHRPNGYFALTIWFGFSSQGARLQTLEFESLEQQPAMPAHLSSPETWSRRGRGARENGAGKGTGSQVRTRFQGDGCVPLALVQSPPVLGLLKTPR